MEQKISHFLFEGNGIYITVSIFFIGAIFCIWFAIILIQNHKSPQGENDKITNNCIKKTDFIGNQSAQSNSSGSSNTAFWTCPNCGGSKMNTTIPDKPFCFTCALKLNPSDYSPLNWSVAESEHLGNPNSTIGYIAETECVHNPHVGNSEALRSTATPVSLSEEEREKLFNLTPKFSLSQVMNKRVRYKNGNEYFIAGGGEYSLVNYENGFILGFGRLEDIVEIIDTK